MTRLPCLLLVFALTGCASMLPGQLSLRPQHPRRVAFDEAALAPYGRPGSGTIDGVLSAVDASGTEHSGADCSLTLTPVTAYTQEQVDRSLGHDETLTAEDPRLRRYVQKGTADRNGRFRFTRLAAGEYYVIGLVGWTESDDSPAYQWACQRVKVAAGQTLELKLSKNPSVR